MHHLDADKTYRQKTWQELHKNAYLNKSWKHHMKQQLYGHLPSIIDDIKLFAKNEKNW